MKKTNTTYNANYALVYYITVVTSFKSNKSQRYLTWNDKALIVGSKKRKFVPYDNNHCVQWRPIEVFSPHSPKHETISDNNFRSSVCGFYKERKGGPLSDRSKIMYDTIILIRFSIAQQWMLFSCRRFLWIWSVFKNGHLSVFVGI